MWLIDQLAEQHILEAQQKGELSQLPGEGAPLKLDDDSAVPPELRSAYRLLKNAGYLPPELEMRREAVSLNDLLKELDPLDHQHKGAAQRLALLKLKLQNAGMSTDFLDSDYRDSLHQRLRREG